MAFHILHTTDDLDAAIRASHEQPIVLFKHSASCPFSARAQEQVANAKHDVDVYGIVVQYKQDLSAAIAERTGVEHQSPQAIVLHRGESLGDYWRSDIQEDTLISEVRRAAGV